MNVVNMFKSRRLRWGATIAVLVLLAFEITVRYLPPDGATITRFARTSYSTGGPATVTTTITSRVYVSPRDTATIDRLSQALNTSPIDGPASFNGLCADATEWNDWTISLTWHGLPVQVWTAHGCPAFSESSGGIPNVFWTRTFPLPAQPLLYP